MTSPLQSQAPRRPSSDRGYAVAETALAIPVVVSVTAVAMSLVLAAMSILGLQDAVHSAARDIARGVPADAVRTSLEAAHPRTTVTVAPSPQGVTVTVHREVAVLGPLLSGLSFPVERRAIVPWETGISP